MFRTAAYGLVLVFLTGPVLAQSAVTLDDFGLSDDSSEPAGSAPACSGENCGGNAFSLDDVVNLGIIIDREATDASNREIELPKIDVAELFDEDEKLSPAGMDSLRDLSGLLKQAAFETYNFAFTGAESGTRGMSMDQAVEVTRTVQQMSGLPASRFVALPPGIAFPGAVTMTVGEGIEVVLIPR